jgi:hypothetical protein
MRLISQVREVRGPPRAAAVRVPREHWAPIVAQAALSGLALAGLLLAMGAASHPSSLVPGRKAGFPGWLHGPLAGFGLNLSTRALVILFLVMCGCYLIVLLFKDAISTRGVVGAIVGLHVVFFLSPILLSTDVFNYLDYGRLGVLHGLNPYQHGPASAPHDPFFPFTGWHYATSVYGPLFTLVTYALVPLGVAGSVWTLKFLTAAASLGCVALVAACAARLGRPPLPAAMFVGLNPVLLVFGVGGVHNDMFMMLLLLGGVYLALTGREASASLSVVSAAAVKASSGLVLPFLVLGAARRGRALVGALIGFAAFAILALAAFGSHGLGFFGAIAAQQRHGSLHSVPKELAQLFGTSDAVGEIRLLALATFVLLCAALLLRTYFDRDWLAAAGWATFALLMTTTWLLPWYVIWLLPFGALVIDSQLDLAALALGGFLIALRIPVLLG